MSVASADRDLWKLQDNFRKKVELRLKDTPEIFVTEAYRSQARQNYLYAQWRTRSWRKVTRTTNSNHTKWIAVDVAFRWGTLYPSSHATRAGIAKKARKYGIDRGFDLWWVDKPHFQDNWVPLNVVTKPKEVVEYRDPLIIKAIKKKYYNWLPWDGVTDRTVLLTMKMIKGETK